MRWGRMRHLVRRIGNERRVVETEKEGEGAPRGQMEVYREKRTSREEIAKYRDNIMFMDIYNNKSKIVLYDCSNVVYAKKSVMSVVYTCLSSFAVSFGSMFVGGGAFVVVVPIWYYIWSDYNLYISSFVEKVVYDGSSKKFEIYKRDAMGNHKIETVDCTDIIFTNDEQLNRKYINYINRKNYETYSIIYKYAWLNIDMFSFLVKQNVRKSLFTDNRDKY